MGMGDVTDALTALRTAHAALAACDPSELTATEVLTVLDDLEDLTRRLPAQQHRLLTALQSQATATDLGAKSWRDVLATRLRISRPEAGRRLRDAALLGPRRALTGDPLEPVLARTAAAQADGVLNPEHVEVIRKTMTRLPAAVDAPTRTAAETDLVRIAAGIAPDELDHVAARLLALLDPDGAAPDDTDRHRQRRLSYRQRPDGMVDLTACLTPTAWATLEAVFARWAAPGMCHPDHPDPCTSGTPSQAHLDTDTRTVSQRRHDALHAIGRAVLTSGELGQHNGLPATIIVRTTLQDLRHAAGIAVTAGGSTLPIADVLRLASHAHHYLAVFDHTTGAALNLFRSRRTASPAQRLMLIARDGGCTKPGCTAPAYDCQAHHATADWFHGGNTNVDDLALACGPDNRMVAPHRWTTTMINGQPHWTPPPALDTGQPRTNTYHHPEHLLRPPDEDPATLFDTAAEPPPDDDPAPSTDTAAEPPPDNRDDGRQGGPEPPDAALAWLA
ncbi:HNH endonuclease signature motif containing protein [Mycolicibacterium grossiae]|uniref:HNH endonuclease signature motif containing protein n=2 Tax=Mycolicibacterium grossiae TaxID=1552759 RepID=UPI0011F1E2A9|nr:HNH endonuclease signature motif containing protein [Mycolicibacterium grossiae]QEM47760.1 HNH endonuclease [Mycolicibacterium grossiae]